FFIIVIGGVGGSSVGGVFLAGRRAPISARPWAHPARAMYAAHACVATWSVVRYAGRTARPAQPRYRRVTSRMLSTVTQHRTAPHPLNAPHTPAIAASPPPNPPPRVPGTTHTSAASASTPTSAMSQRQIWRLVKIHENTPRPDPNGFNSWRLKDSVCQPRV